MSAIQSILAEQLDIWTSAATEKKSGRGRSGGNGISVYGIQKLRELILELAVRGQLVPQDPNDEPAGELLKRIQAEKAKLIAEGKIKKDKPFPPISDEEKPFELPQGWEWVLFGETCEIERGGSPRPIKSYLTNAPDGLNWIKIGDTERGGKYITSTSEKISRNGLSKTRMVYPGDFLLTNSMSFGRPYITKIKGCIHDGWLRISPPESLYKDYLYSLLSSSYVLNLFRAAAAGAVVMNLNSEKVRELPIPIPPLPEQHRIVAKVDELMALCDQLEAQHNNAAEAHEQLVNHLLGTLTQSHSADEFGANWQRIAAHFDKLFTTEASIDTLKQTLLQLAVIGKLVPQDPNDEPVGELLKRIQAEKTRLIAEGKIKKDKPLPPITNEEKPFELPQGWRWGKLGNVLINITDGTHHSPPNIQKEAFKYISAKNMKSSGIDLSEITYVTKTVHNEIYGRCDPVLGDILYIKDGATTGIATINTLDEPFSMLSSVALLKPSVGTNNQFLLKTITSPLFYAEMRAEMTGVAITRVTLAKLNNALIPLPPLAEQHRIVTKVDELMALCDQLKSTVAQSRQLQQKLADVVVEQAVVS